MKGVSPALERQKNSQSRSKAVAYVFRNGRLFDSYLVINISDKKMVLVGADSITPGEEIEVILQFPGYPSSRRRARVDFCLGSLQVGYTLTMEFVPDPSVWVLPSDNAVRPGPESAGQARFYQLAP